MKKIESDARQEIDEVEEWEEAGLTKPPWLDFEHDNGPEQAESDGGRIADPSEIENQPGTVNELNDPGNRSADGPDPFTDLQSDDRFPEGHPVRFAEELTSVYDLEHAINEYGRTIYVEEWEAYTHKPKIWYEFTRQKVLVKSVRRANGIYLTSLGKTKYTDRVKPMP